MIIVEGYARLADPSRLDEFRAAAEKQIAASRAEQGCIEYGYAIDLLDPSMIRVSERWKDWAALESHFKEPHMAVWRATLADLKIAERSLRAHEVKDTRDL